jgi:hypothetical protein
MMRFLRSLWPSHPRRDQATLDGLRLTGDLLDREKAGKRVRQSEWDRAQALLANMPSYEELYRRRSPRYEDWFGH